jgi:putative ABC transport system substrate-binding protein
VTVTTSAETGTGFGGTVMMTPTGNVERHTPRGSLTRRYFLSCLGGAAVAWPLPARAQQSASKAVRIGFLGVSLDAPGTAALYQHFLDELLENGFSEGQNLIVEYRRSDDPRGIFVAAAELMRLQVDLIVAQGPEVALQDVVGASPGGNITGLFYRQAELAAKKVELLTQAFPERTRLAILWDALVAEEFSAAEHAAELVHLQLRALKLENPPYDFAAALRTLVRDGAQMLLVLSSPLFAESRARLANLAIEHRLPSMFIFKSYVEAGGLMTYSVDQATMYRRTGAYVARILKGAKPADLPVEQPTKFEFVINLKTAKALGLVIPDNILALADQVIE